LSTSFFCFFFFFFFFFLWLFWFFCVKSMVNVIFYFTTF
jgi:hypothetical protein